jgi:hypothetical protein
LQTKKTVYYSVLISLLELIIVTLVFYLFSHMQT